jgi:hypothetical protein
VAAQAEPTGPEPTAPKAQRPVASHGPAQRQLLLWIGLAFCIEPLHIPVGADEAAHNRLGLAPAAGGDFRLPGLLVGSPLGIFGLLGECWLTPLLQDGAEPEAGAEAEAAAEHHDGQAVVQGFLDDGTGGGGDHGCGGEERASPRTGQLRGQGRGSRRAASRSSSPLTPPVTASP